MALKPMKEQRKHSGSRKRKSIILMAVEGNKTNKTETLYFKNFICSNCIIKFASGNDTDLLHLLESLEKGIMKNDLHLSMNDRAYLIADTDVPADEVKKKEEIRKVISNASPLVQCVFSNPCFEVWFLLHFKYTTKQFSTSTAVVNALKRYLPNYEKGKSCYHDLIMKEHQAMTNAKKLKNYHESNGHFDTVSQNPSSDIFLIFEELAKRK